ncbi:MAG: fasciclin domain-containing protein [Flavobacteriales bacterium]
MEKLMKPMLVLAAAGLLTMTATAQGMKKADAGPNTVLVGGEPMYPMKNIVENAVNSKDHTTLVAAVKAAGLVETLQGEGPFTVFAPTNQAFAALPAGTVDGLLKPEAKGQLTTVLTYHVLAGTLDMKALKAAIEKGGGQAKLKTVAGQEITLAMNGPHNIQVWDQNGAYANISTYDVMQKNGVIHVIDRVLLPKM